MEQQPLSEPLSGVGITAIGVALIRARESERDDRLYDDPHARAFGDAARDAFVHPLAPSGAADTWARVERLVDVFYEGRSVAVRMVDDAVWAALAAGCRQVVLLGAGLDTRAFRMSLPGHVELFEVDLPAMFAFKEPVLRAGDASPTCGRHVVPADLRGDWRGPLEASGFDTEAPTAWVDEGSLAYLAAAEARRAVADLGAISAAGSQFRAAHIPVVDTGAPHYCEMSRLVSGGQQQRWEPCGLGPDAEEWLRGQGWRVELQGWDDLLAPLGRGGPAGSPGSGLILAVRG